MTAQKSAGEKHTFYNGRGQKLAALFYPAAGKTLLVVCHGFTGSKEGRGRALAMAQRAAELGYPTFLFDFAGCGESEGDFAGVTLSGHIDDLKCALDYCRAAGYRRAVTVGRSFGGTTVLCHAADDGRVAGVCTWAAPADPYRLFSALRGETAQTGLVPLHGDAGTVYVREAFFSDLASYDVPARAAAVSPRPLLVVHGSADAVVPPDDALAIYSRAGQPKELFIVPGADHQFTDHYREVWEAMFSWLQKHFPAS